MIKTHIMDIVMAWSAVSDIKFGRSAAIKSLLAEVMDDQKVRSCFSRDA